MCELHVKTAKASSKDSYAEWKKYTKSKIPIQKGFIFNV